MMQAIKKKCLGDNGLVRLLLGTCLIFLTGFSAPGVRAATVEITAAFSPDSSNPHINKFVNTTTNSGVCATYPLICGPRGLFSIALSLKANTQRPIPANHTNIREGAMVKVPAEARAVEVASTSGHRAEVLFSISAFSARNYTRDVRLITGRPGSDANSGHDYLWGGKSWGFYAPAPCTRGAGMGAAWEYANFFWFTPQSSPCGFKPAFEIDTLEMSRMSVSYLMTAPDPLKMESGIYRGTITYTVGPGGDFDFGDNLFANDSSITFNFTLDVRHTLKFQLPPGAGKVTLNPAGGWQQWIDRGRRPEKLSSSQQFKIWSSTAFSVSLQCEYLLGTQCGIQNPAGHTVPVETRVTLPNGLQDASGRPVERLLLSTSPQVISSSHYVDDGLSTLNFEVARDQVKSMIDDHSGSTYRGNITVIWDSDIPT